jgi:protein-disulfide isomerase
VNRTALVGLALVVLLGGFALAASAFRAGDVEAVAEVVATQSEVLVPPHAIRYGDESAKVVIVEFYDPACETCARVAPVVKGLVKDSGGRVQLVLRYAPLHKGASDVAILLEATRKQDRYWETLDLLLSTQERWTVHHAVEMSRVFALLEESGHDIVALNTAMQDPKLAALVAQDTRDAQTLGVKATPEFFVNGKPLPEWGMGPLKALVDSETARLYGR